MVQHGAQQPLQRSEGQRRLGLDAPDAEHLHVRAEVTGAAGGVREQRRLPDAGQAAHHEGATTAGTGLGDEGRESGSLGVAPVQHRTEPTIRRR